MTEAAEVLIADVDGTRLDQFVALRLERYARSHVKALIERGWITVDGRRCRPDRRLKAGDRVEVASARVDWGANDFESWVLHEDPALLVLNKPAGLLMHPLGASWLREPAAALSEPEPNLAGILQGARPRIAAAGTPRCGIVHRLDRQTSGVLLVAKTPAASAALIEAFKAREMGKRYRAIVRGVPADKAPRVQAPIGRLPGHRKVTVTPFGKAAETGFKVLAAARAAALVEAEPLTGRTHQIRAHLALLGHPVMGDAEFDRREDGGLWPPRLMLHAYRIELAHPATGKPVSYTAEPPKDFREFWALCRKPAKR